jgi:hypothetical protein
LHLGPEAGDMRVVSGDRDGEHDQRRRRSESDSASALAIRAAQPRPAAASFERTLKFHHRPSRPADFIRADAGLS